MRLPELTTVEVHGITRADFILRGALAAAAASGGAAAGPFVAQALAQTATADAGTLAFLAGLEDLQAAFYAAALKNGKLSGKAKSLATEFEAHEKAHAETLKQTIQTLGGPSPKAPKTSFSAGGGTTFLRTAAGLEDAAVAAYNGAIPSLRTPDIVAAAATIVQVEARHAAALRFQAGQDPAPSAFDRASGRTQAEAALRKGATA